MNNNLKNYVDKFNSDDHEYTKTSIENSESYNWLFENIPLIDIPDKDIEETYYFRYWTFRPTPENLSPQLLCHGCFPTKPAPKIP